MEQIPTCPVDLMCDRSAICHLFYGARAQLKPDRQQPDREILLEEQ
jgi:hypothetical protein